MTPQDIIERLLRDNPQLHILSEYHVSLLMGFGLQLKPGLISHAVPPELIRYLLKSVKSDDLTIETGGGHTTVAFAALAKHHTCVTNDESNVELTKKYMHQIGIPEEKVTFVLESSDTALPKLPAVETFDFAFIDGNHAYPFPALDWHFIDKRLKIGGIIGFDNTELRAVYDHCMILEENKTYTLIERFVNPSYGLHYGANFYTKVRDDERETFKQPYNLKRAQKMTLREHLRAVRRRQQKFWPWD
jgi:hypothetical protein